MVKIIPTTTREQYLWQKGVKFVAGIDEAGRGAWAGPVVAAAVVVAPDHQIISGVADSKLLSPKRREKLFEQIKASVLSFGVGVVDSATIDEIGILNATKLASQRAVESLDVNPEYLLTDALDLKKYLDIPQEAHVKGDQKIYSISCASIIAKVTRDGIMSALDEEYGCYQFSLHKGYGTRLHMERLGHYGVSDIHRRSYKPIRDLVT